MSKEAASRIQSNSDITGKILVLKNAHRILQIKTPANDFFISTKRNHPHIKTLFEVML
jgi:hypothetical protein